MTDYRVGNLAEKYETSNRGPGYVSNGSSWGDPGGDSYGSYQLESKLGTLQEYLKVGDKYTNALGSFTINSDNFKAMWRRLGADDSEGFQQSQFDFLCKKRGGYNDAIQYAKVLGWAADNFALQSAIFSTCNQSGRWKTQIFDMAGIEKGDSVTVQINKLYDARAAYFRRIKIPEKVRSSILKQRTVEERKDCLKLL